MSFDWIVISFGISSVDLGELNVNLGGSFAPLYLTLGIKLFGWDIFVLECIKGSLTDSTIIVFLFIYLLCGYCLSNSSRDKLIIGLFLANLFNSSSRSVWYLTFVLLIIFKLILKTFILVLDSRRVTLSLIVASFLQFEKDLVLWLQYTNTITCHPLHFYYSSWFRGSSCAMHLIFFSHSTNPYLYSNGRSSRG